MFERDSSCLCERFTGNKNKNLFAFNHLQWIMNTEVSPICIEHVHTAHSCLILLLELFIISYYYEFKHRRQFQHLNYLERRLIMLLWRKLFFINWFGKFRLRHSPVPWSPILITVTSRSLWFIFLWFQPFKAQAAKHRNEQPLVYRQHFGFCSLLLLFLVYHNFSKGSVSASLMLLLFVPRTT